MLKLNEFSSSSVWQFVGVCDAELPGTWWTTVRPSLIMMSSVVSIYVPPVVVSSWCRVTVSTCSAVGPSQWLVRCSGTHNRTVSVMTTFQTTVSNIHWKHFSLVDIDVPSAAEVFTTLRYINVHLLTYLLSAPFATMLCGGFWDVCLYVVILWFVLFENICSNPHTSVYWDTAGPNISFVWSIQNIW